MKLVTLGVSIMLAGLLLATDVFAASVRGYHRKHGTYVQPHHRTNPDSNPYNNFNFPGNDNPNTGRITGGSQERYLDNYYNNRNNTWLGSQSDRLRW